MPHSADSLPEALVRSMQESEKRFAEPEGRCSR